jgi:hypothetical protein
MPTAALIPSWTAVLATPIEDWIARRSIVGNDMTKFENPPGTLLIFYGNSPILSALFVAI